jgi:DNA invertase Pin-like site-specific DNA recombinase
MSRRCAIYARYSSDLQRESSIEDQIRRCREYAARQGWVIVEQFVATDKAISAASVAGRDALQGLLAASKRKDHPFDCLLVDDTSRLARDLSDALRTVKVLEFNHVSVVSVSQGIDSAQGNARPLLAMHGIMDEQFLADLAKKVHRGQEGRALHGYTTGGRLYGYTNVPIEDPNRKGKYGRPAVLGVKLEVHPQQAEVVNQIFAMYAEGIGQATIAVKLNEAGIPGPYGVWSKYTIHEMLRNERYHGVNVWGRTKKQKNPETGRKISRRTHESEWRRVEAPELRIVSEELWQAVAARCKRAEENSERIGGGMHRGRSYIFSGALVCGVCGGNMVICAGGGKRGYVKYGCHQHKHNGQCANKMMIRQDRLEEQLLGIIEQRLLSRPMMDALVNRVEQELKRRLAEMAHSGTLATLENLRKDLEDRKRRQAKLIEAIESAGEITAISSRLKELENEIRQIQSAITDHRPVNIENAVSGIRQHVTNAVLQLKESLIDGGGENVARAKEAIAKHVGKLVLTPETRDGCPVYRVAGNLSFPEPDKCRMLKVARDGIGIWPPSDSA